MAVALAQLPEQQQRPKVRLAYTRKHGWVVVRWTLVHYSPSDDGRMYGWVVRPRGAHIRDYEVLAWADLPPVPEAAL